MVFKRHALRTLATLLIAAAAVGCVSGNDDDDDTVQLGSKGDSFSVTTYNVGLAPTFVPYTDERVAVNAAFLPTHEADVLCLQEVWLPEHVAALTEGMKPTYPHVYYTAPDQKLTDGAPCTTDDLTGLVSCVEASCDNLSGDALTGCILASCGDALNALQASDSTCAGAVFAQVGSTLEAAVSAVTQPAGLFAFGGSNGLILASKHPLKNTQLLDFKDKSTSNHRSALFATVDAAGADRVVGCTHLTANLGNSVPYTGPYASWEEEGNDQARLFIEFADDYAKGNPTYLAGDVNCSIPNPALGVQGDFEANCQRFLDAGYRDAAAEQVPCTFCESNLVITSQAGGGGEGNLLLDHVFTKNVPPGAKLTAERVMDDPVTVPTAAGDLTLDLSDHYGVRLTESH